MDTTQTAEIALWYERTRYERATVAALRAVADAARAVLDEYKPLGVIFQLEVSMLKLADALDTYNALDED